MAILNPTVLLTSYSTYHLLISYYLLTQPSLLPTNSIITILGEALSLPSAALTTLASSPLDPKTSPNPLLHPTQSFSAFAAPNTATGLASIVLAFLAISDLAAVATLSWERAGREYWANSVLIRLVLCFGGIAAILLRGRLGSAVATAVAEDGVLTATLHEVGEGIAVVANSLVFALGFVELVWLFMIFNAIRDEKKEELQRRNERVRKEQYGS